MASYIGLRIYAVYQTTRQDILFTIEIIVHMHMFLINKGIDDGLQFS